MARLGVLLVAMLGGCLRAPIELEPDGATEGESESSTGLDEADGPGMTGPLWPTDGTEASTGDALPTCHPAYVPCLPVVDDLDCDEVRAMGAAPVEVVGDDPYGLDADHDGLGCEP